MPGDSEIYEWFLYHSWRFTDCWKSKKQISVSLSFAEAEYRSMRQVVYELTWFTRLLSDISVLPSLLVLVLSDNKASFHIARNLFLHERTKHVELDGHFVQQQFLSGLITLSYVPSSTYLADLFTKSMSGPSHKFLLTKLGVTFLPFSLKEDVEKKPHDPICTRDDEMQRLGE